MKVIKRDGRAVDFNREKISIAIEKANVEVKAKDKATKEEIEQIIEYIEDLDKKRILVEDIQDIIERKLMEKKRFNLAKKYIVYRYTRALIRKQNTTDESILGLIKNANKEVTNNIITVSMQRDLIAGEVSKDLTKRILLPEKITKAHEENILHFHNAEYFLQPMIDSCVVNIEDMLDNGTVINNKMIESPNTFLEACNVLIQIIIEVGSSQYGMQYLEIESLAKYLNKSYDKYIKQFKEEYSEKISNEIIIELVNDSTQKELREGIKNLIYNINTLLTANGKTALVTMILNSKESSQYSNENRMICEELQHQLKQKVKNGIGQNIELTQPELIDIGRIEEKQIQKLLGYKFNQGKVSINLFKIAVESNKDESKFWPILDKRLELCREALMYRHYALLGTFSDISPIHWRYGAISRLESGEKIDKLLKEGYSTLTLGSIGLDKTVQYMKEDNISKEANEFVKKIQKHIKEKMTEWKKESGIEFVLV